MIKNKIATLAISMLAGLIITGGVVGALAFNGPSTAHAAPQSTTGPTAPKSNVEPAAVQSTEQQVENKVENGAPEADKAEANKAEKQDSAEKDSANEAADDAALATKATITAAQAEEAAKAAYPDCKITGTKLGDENGVVIFEVSIADKSGKALEVKVDANSAKVLPGDSNADDKQEAGDQETDGDNLQQEGEN